MKPPTNATELRTFLGMVTYVLQGHVSTTFSPASTFHKLSWTSKKSKTTLEWRTKLVSNSSLRGAISIRIVGEVIRLKRNSTKRVPLYGLAGRDRFSNPGKKKSSVAELISVQTDTQTPRGSYSPCLFLCTRGTSARPLKAAFRICSRWKVRYGIPLPGHDP